MLNNTNPEDIDLILIQEPYINHLHLTSATPQWSVLYPSQHLTHPKDTRTVTFISTKLSSDATQQFNVNSSNILTVTIKTLIGTIEVYNSYLDRKHSDTSDGGGGAAKTHIQQRDSSLQNMGWWLQPVPPPYGIKIEITTFSWWKTSPKHKNL